MNKKEHNKSEVFIRSDGWVFTKDGLDRLKDGGMKGHQLSEKKITDQLGRRHKVRRPLDPTAVKVIRGIGGYFIPRAMFVSNAIVKEAERRAKGSTSSRLPYDPADRAVFVILTLTDDAYAVVEDMDNEEYREFVSSAIVRAAKKTRKPE